MGFLGAFNMFSCLVNRQKVSQTNMNVDLPLSQLLRTGFLQNYLKNAAPHQLCLAHSRSAVIGGSLPLSHLEPALAAGVGPAVGTSAPALTLGIRGRELGLRGWVHAWGGRGVEPLSPQNAGRPRSPAAPLECGCPSSASTLCKRPAWLWAGHCSHLPLCRRPSLVQ